MSNEEKQRLNQRGRNILIEAGLNPPQEVDYDWIRRSGGAGYAHYYLGNSWNSFNKTNEADASVYCKLLDIDSEFGTELSEQLFWCLQNTSRWHIIKVRILL